MIPGWAEMAGTVAVLRGACSAASPVVARIGHGGVMRAVDWLPDDAAGWLLMAAADGRALGWSPASAWSGVELPAAGREGVVLELDSDRSQLTVRRDDAPLLTAPVSPGAEGLPRGEYAVVPVQPGGDWRDVDGAYHALAWPLAIDGVGLLAGAYWHNDFGQAAHGPALHVAPFVARWLTMVCGQGSALCIR
jgi:hypothetical protein